LIRQFALFFRQGLGLIEVAVRDSVDKARASPPERGLINLLKDFADNGAGDADEFLHESLGARKECFE
ncbi:MAG: hypothetical protein RLZZ598_953, partial [Pseudomonadota bacterium]